MNFQGVSAPKVVSTLLARKFQHGFSPTNATGSTKVCSGEDETHPVLYRFSVGTPSRTDGLEIASVDEDLHEVCRHLPRPCLET